MRVIFAKFPPSSFRSLCICTHSLSPQMLALECQSEKTFLVIHKSRELLVIQFNTNTKSHCKHAVLSLFLHILHIVCSLVSLLTCYYSGVGSAHICAQNGLQMQRCRLDWTEGVDLFHLILRRWFTNSRYLI